MQTDDREAFAQRIAKAMNCTLPYAREQVDLADTFDGHVEEIVSGIEQRKSTRDESKP